MAGAVDQSAGQRNFFVERPQALIPHGLIFCLGFCGREGGSERTPEQRRVLIRVVSAIGKGFSPQKEGVTERPARHVVRSGVAGNERRKQRDTLVGHWIAFIGLLRCLAFHNAEDGRESGAQNLAVRHDFAVAILVIRERAIGHGEGLEDGSLEVGGAREPVLFFRGRTTAFFTGVGHSEQTAVVEAVRGERLEQDAIGNFHALGIRGAGDVMEERLAAI